MLSIFAIFKLQNRGVKIISQIDKIKQKFEDFLLLCIYFILQPANHLDNLESRISRSKSATKVPFLDFGFCEWHSHEPYSTCHSLPLWLKPLTKMSYFTNVTQMLQNWHTCHNVIHIMKNTCIHKLTHKIWATECDQ